MNEGNKIWKLLKKILKIFLWITGIVVILLVALIFIVQIESVQNFLIRKATTYVSDRTHTRVEIGHIKISFPKEIVLENVFLDDLKKDTLLFAGEVGINVEMLGLLKHRLNIDHFRMENMYASIYRKNDSTYNYSFLVNVFASDSGVKATDTSSTPMEISLNRLSLQNIRLQYSDSISGTSMNSSLGKLELKMNVFNVPKVQYHAENLDVENTSISMITFANHKVADTSHSKPPDLQLKKLSLKNFHFTQQDLTNGDLTDASIGKGEIDAKDISMQTSKADFKSIVLENADVKMITHQSNDVKQKNNSSSPWKFSRR